MNNTDMNNTNADSEKQRYFYGCMLTHAQGDRVLGIKAELVAKNGKAMANMIYEGALKNFRSVLGKEYTHDFNGDLLIGDFLKNENDKEGMENIQQHLTSSLSSSRFSKKRLRLYRLSCGKGGAVETVELITRRRKAAPAPAGNSWKCAAPTEELAQSAAPVLGQAWTLADLKLTLMPIQPGTFMMGSINGRDDERPQTQVKLTKPYWLGKTQVMQAQWEAIMGENSSTIMGPILPVESVSWYDAMAFCAALTQRESAAGRLPAGYVYTLPTEAQWEYACRAGTTGDYAGDLDAMAWHWNNSAQKAHAVGMKQANAWGLHDMHGNVWEWCRDWYAGLPGGSLTDPIGAANHTCHVSRGGSWNSTDECRAAYRFKSGTDGYLHGFRLALACLTGTAQKRQPNISWGLGEHETSCGPCSSFATITLELTYQGWDLLWEARAEDGEGWDDDDDQDDEDDEDEDDDDEDSILRESSGPCDTSSLLGAAEQAPFSIDPECFHRMLIDSGEDELIALSEELARCAATAEESANSAALAMAPAKLAAPAMEPVQGAAPVLGQAWTLADLKLTLMPIHPGTFMMGSENGGPDEKPQTQVTLTKPYWLGQTEVTQAQWEAIMGTTFSTFTGPTLPVELVSWEKAMAFCAALTEREEAAGRLPAGYVYTLPTEAQWEYACRAGTTGDYAGDLDAMAWYAYNSGGKTHPVATKQANAWGLYDMHGNLWEWCRDWEGDYPGGSVTDSDGPVSGSRRVRRGGGWTNDAAYCRSAIRSRGFPGFRNYPIGCRLALAPTMKPAYRAASAEELAGSAAPALDLVQSAAPVLGQAWTLAELKLTLMPIHPGTFMMGSENGGLDEWPQTEVTLSMPYWLGKTQVTQAQWEAIMGTIFSTFTGPTLPVESVSWDEAMAFCAALTRREEAAGRLPAGYEYTLPTEAQWEYACRAGTSGDYAGDMDAMAWYIQNSGYKTHPVATKQANAWGLYDMHGNVWEWCRDRVGDYPGDSVTDPNGPASGSCRIFRGGCWSYAAAHCSSTHRSKGERGFRLGDLGFRLALAPKVEQ